MLRISYSPRSRDAPAEYRHMISRLLQGYRRPLVLREGRLHIPDRAKDEDFELTSHGGSSLLHGRLQFLLHLLEGVLQRPTDR